MVKEYVIVNVECNSVYDVAKNDDYVYGCYDATDFLEQTISYIEFQGYAGQVVVTSINEAIKFWTEHGYYVYIYERVYPKRTELWDLKYLNKDNTTTTIDTFPTKPQAQVKLQYFRNRGLLTDNQYFLEKRYE